MFTKTTTGPLARRIQFAFPHPGPLRSSLNLSSYKKKWKYSGGIFFWGFHTKILYTVLTAIIHTTWPYLPIFINLITVNHIWCDKQIMTVKSMQFSPSSCYWPVLITQNYGLVVMMANNKSQQESLDRWHKWPYITC